MYVCMYVCVYLSIYVYMYVCVYIIILPPPPFFPSRAQVPDPLRSTGPGHAVLIAEEIFDKFDEVLILR